MSLRSVTRITSKMNEAPLFNNLGIGATSRIFLIGHADGLTINEPYGVGSMSEALEVMNRDDQSPLVRALLEAYYAGARDIWVVATAPMSEYVPYEERETEEFYVDYAIALSKTYNILKKWDLPQITVPVEAPFNTTVDFLTPLANYCAEATHISGDIHLGILGTRGVINKDYVNAMASDVRLDQALNGKFVSIFAGDGVFSFNEISNMYSTSIATVTAAQLATLPMDRSITGKTVKNAHSLVGPDMDKSDVAQLAELGINTATRNSRGRRGVPYQVTYNSDNTLAPVGSEFWSLATMRLVSAVSNEIRTLGKRRIGTIGFGLFKQEVESYLIMLSQADIVRGYSVSIGRDPRDSNTVIVDLVLMPYFGVREIHVPIYVGPNQGGA